jgi:amino acid transporter
MASAIVGGLWFEAVTTLTIFGVHLAASFQKVMTAIEAIALLVLAIAAWLKFSAAPQNPFSLNWFSPFAFGDFSTFMAGMLVAVFYFFGWDVSSNVAEETENSNAAPSNSGIIGMIGIVILFMLIQMTVQMGMTTKMVEKNGANLLAAFGNLVLPRPWGQIALLAVLLSTVGTIETQMTQCARTVFSMGRDRSLHLRAIKSSPLRNSQAISKLIKTI